MKHNPHSLTGLATLKAFSRGYYTGAMFSRDKADNFADKLDSLEVDHINIVILVTLE